ncbi:MAG: cyclic nucleotide-binding domain-containing protein [Actinomycetota bacterium]|nr:cyclic nucleotide-binding domain-containing protein [Actinomycetota bacterium]
MSHRHDVDEHLLKVPLFSRLDDKELIAVRSLLTEVEVQTGAVLAREGTHGHEFLIIVSGTASVDRGGVHVADVGPGDFQGEISLLDGGNRTATVTATSPMTLLVASNQEFHSLLENTPSIACRMLPALAARLRAVSGDAVTH